jgi:hypothetical protein
MSAFVTDNQQGRGGMTDNRDPDRITTTETTTDRAPADHTTVIHTEGRSGGGGGIALAVLVLLILFLLFIFREDIFGAADNVDKVDVEVTTNAN